MDGQATHVVDGSPPSIADLLGDVVADAQNLMRGEVELAKAEVRAEIRSAREGIIAMAIGGAVAAVGGLMLVMMVVRLLTDVVHLDLWVSYLIVGAVMAGAGLLLLQHAQSRFAHLDPVPHETIDSVRKDLKWIRQPLPSDKT